MTTRAAASPAGSVVVVGAGPAGLMLAGELATGGVEVTVLEQLPAPTTESRASTLHARTMELFVQRGLLDPLRELAGTGPDRTIACAPRGHVGGLPLDLGAVPSRYPGQWKVLQALTERLLADRARHAGARVVRGVEVIGLQQDRDAVAVTVAGPDDGDARVVHADFVVGCDGERSAVRELAGFAIDVRPARHEMIRADVAAIDIRDRRFERTAHGLAVASRRPDGVTRVMASVAGRAPSTRSGPPSFTEVCEIWRTVTGEDISTGSPVWLDAFDDAALQVRHHRLGRVLLAGDAAHVQLPVGGQALNLALQDAVALGWRLAAEVRGDAPGGLLDSYHAERHAAARHALTGIVAQSTLLLGGPEVDGARGVLAELLALPVVAASFAAGVAGTGVRYPSRPGDHPLVGSRFAPGHALAGSAPDAGGPHAASRGLADGRGVLLCGPHAAHDDLVRALRPWADRVEVAALPAAEPGPVSALAELPADAVLLRPDGHIAWAAPSAVDPVDAVRRWFGPPRPDRHTGTTSAGRTAPALSAATAGRTTEEVAP